MSVRKRNSMPGLDIHEIPCPAKWPERCSYTASVLLDTGIAGSYTACDLLRKRGIHESLAHAPVSPRRI